MLHYEMSKAVADQRIRELVASSGRRALLSAARADSASATGSSRHVKDLTTALVALFQVRRGTAVGSTATSGSGAGPMGCAA